MSSSEDVSMCHIKLFMNCCLFHLIVYDLTVARQGTLVSNSSDKEDLFHSSREKVRL